MEYVTVYLEKYFDLVKDKEDYLVIYMNEDIEVVSNMDQQIFNYLYPNENYQGEINVIECQRLFGGKKQDIEKRNYLEIVGDEVSKVAETIKIKEKYKYLADYVNKMEDE